MKKLFSIVLCLVLLLFTACSQGSVDSSTATTAPSVTTSATTAEPAAQGIKNIILIIGDGMGPVQVRTGELTSGKEFSFLDWQHASVNTNSVDLIGDPIKTTDSAASATALATGVLTINGMVGQDPDGKNLKTIMDYAQEYGKSTGVVTTDTMDGATPAGFSGHSKSRNVSIEILLSQLDSGINLLCAQYSSDPIELRDYISGRGYTLCDSISEVPDSFTSEKAYWLLNNGGWDAADKLTKVTNHALDYLSQDPDGFVLMIEQAQIDKFGHSNDFDGNTRCVGILNDTVETILNWVGDREDTAILITADHETGGLQVSTEPEYNNSYPCADGSSIYYTFTSTGHTDTEVDLFVYGFTPDFSQYYTEDRPASIKNTNIFDMMLDLLKDPLQEN